MSIVAMPADGAAGDQFAMSPMTPRFVTVSRRYEETADVVTFEIPGENPASGDAGFAPGQFNMLYAFGIGEVPISISGDPGANETIVHTVRAVGPASAALTRLERGESVGVRGPFGSSWPVTAAAGADVLLIAGGIGMAPLRPALYHVLRHRARYGRVALLYGARTPEDLLFRRELDAWRRTPDLQVRVTVDAGSRDWTGDVGVVTKLLSKIRFGPLDTIAMICGPEVMIRFTVAALEANGLTRDQIFVSMERNMKCAIGWCGHCQFGPHFVCRDGPVFRYDRLADLIGYHEI